VTSLDRAQIERVLARAAELQAQRSPDATGQLSDEQILELGTEVGLSADALRQAIAEERGRVTAALPRGPAGAWFGASQFSATRVVAGTPASVLATLDAHLRGELPFEVKRRFPDRLLWEPKGGLLQGLRQITGARSEGSDLVLAEEVGAVVVAVDAERTHVRLDASVAARRRSAAQITLGMLGVSALGAWALWALSASVGATLVLPGLIATLGTLLPRRSFRGDAERVELALSQVLDRLEYGPARRKGLAAGVVDKLLGPEGLGGL
jgi:hypothetical protein